VVRDILEREKRRGKRQITNPILLRKIILSSIRYEVKEDTVLPITVISMDNLYAASRISLRISTTYCALYLIEVLATVAVYWKKRRKV